MKTWFSKRNQNQEIAMNQSEQEIEQAQLHGSRTAILIQLLPFLIMIATVFGFAFYVKYETTLFKQLSQVSIAREADILSALNEIQSQIDILKTDHQQITELKTNLANIQQTMVNQQSLSGLAKTTELQKIGDQLKELQRAIIPTHYPKTQYKALKPAALTTTPISLPFKVESLDMMAGQLFASVLYRQNILPVSLNDSLLGWKLVRMNATDGIAVWENAANHTIKIITSRRPNV